MSTLAQPDTALLETVRAGRQRSDERGGLADDTVHLLRDRGMFKLAVPRALGGLEAQPAHIFDLLAKLADADVAAAWLVWNNLLPPLLARRAERHALELLADPRAVFANSTRVQGTAERVGAGYVVNGRWQLVSGSDVATHFALLCMATAGGVQREVSPGVGELRLAFLDAGDTAVLDTWHTSGLRGTASHDIIVNGVVVSEDRCVAVGPVDPATVGALYRMPVVGLMAAGCVTMLLSLASAALQTFNDLASDPPTPTDARQAFGERPSVHIAAASAAGAIAAATYGVDQAVDCAWAEAEAGAVGACNRSLLFEAVHTASDIAARTIRDLIRHAGTAALYTSCPFDHINRDAQAMRHHVVLNELWTEQAGRVRLGLPPTLPLFLL